MSESFPTDAAESRMVEPDMEAAGIEPARHSPRKYRPEHDTPERLEWHRRLGAAYHAEEQFLAEFEVRLYHRRAVLLRGSFTHLYVIADAFDAVKIGIAVKPVERLANLQIGNWRPLLLLAATPATPQLEQFIHEQLASERISGEWFTPSNRTLAVVELIVAAAEQCDDIERYEGRAEPGDTIAILTYRAEMVFRRAA